MRGLSFFEGVETVRKTGREERDLKERFARQGAHDALLRLKAPPPGTQERDREGTPPN